MPTRTSVEGCFSMQCKQTERWHKCPRALTYKRLCRLAKRGALISVTDKCVNPIPLDADADDEQWDDVTLHSKRQTVS